MTKIFDEYSEFVDGVTNKVGKDDELFSKRAQELSVWMNGNYARMDNAVAGLTGEVGEVADLWKKIKYHDKELSAETKQRLFDELSDVCWYVMQTSIALGVKMDDVIEHNMNKLKARHPKGFSPEYMKHKQD